MVGRAGGAPRRAVPRRQQHRGARAHLPRAPPAPHYLVSPCIPFPCAASFCACGRSIILLACAQGCSRPRLVIFEKTAPDEIATVNTSFERVPDHWIHPDGNINFCVSRGTLIPAADRKKPPMETADRAIAMIPQAAGLSRGPARVVAARPATPPLMPGGPPPLGLGHTPPLPPYPNGMPGMQNGGLPPGMGYPNGMMGKYNPYAAQMYANGLAGGQLNGMGGPHHAPQQAMPAHGFNNTRLPMSQPAQMANAIMTSNAMSGLNAAMNGFANGLPVNTSGAMNGQLPQWNGQLPQMDGSGAFAPNGFNGFGVNGQNGVPPSMLNPYGAPMSSHPPTVASVAYPSVPYHGPNTLAQQPGMNNGNPLGSPLLMNTNGKRERPEDDVAAFNGMAPGVGPFTPRGAIPPPIPMHEAKMSAPRSGGLDLLGDIATLMEHPKPAMEPDGVVHEVQSSPMAANMMGMPIAAGHEIAMPSA